MNKHDRAKLLKRLHEAIPWLASGHPQDQDQIVDACISEVDRAVRAERKAWKDAEKIWESHRRRAEERFIERAKGLGRK
jgi:ferric-dicitrate binding protein FerR (iron transport regulator)